MAEFLTTKGISAHIEDIIRNAKNKLVLISPYIQLSKIFLERLQDTDRRNVKITLVFRKGALKPDEGSQLSQLKNLSLYFCEDLHAKCYFNEERMLLTSMNMYESSEKNREMGVLIRANDDRELFGDALKEAESIVNASAKDDLKKHKDVSYYPRTDRKGYCIRCRRPIPYDLDRPHCYECFLEWVEWGNRDYEESYCHACGEPAPVTKAMPRCDSCYDRSRRKKWL